MTLSPIDPHATRTSNEPGVDLAGSHAAHETASRPASPDSSSILERGRSDERFPQGRSGRPGHGSRAPQSRIPMQTFSRGSAAATDAPGVTASAASSFMQVAPPDTGLGPQETQVPLVAHPMSELPTTLAGQEEAFKWCLNRPIDCQQIVDNYKAVCAYGPRAYGGDVEPARNNAALMQVAEQHLMPELRALGMSGHDINTLLNWSSKISGLTYPNASLPVNLIQYVAAPLLSGAGHNEASIALAALAAGPGFLLTGVLQQPLAVLPSEHLAEKLGPLVAVDKENVNYREYRPLMAEKAKVQAVAHRLVAARYRAEIAGQPLGEELARWTRQQGRDYLAALPAEQRAALRTLAQHMAQSTATTHATHKTLMATEGAHHRQTLGASAQRAPRILRPIGQGGLGFLSGAKPEDIALGLQHVARHQTLAPGEVAGLQVAWAVICQVWQHGAAAFDETNKVKYKAMLDMAYGDRFTAAGQAKIARGIDPGPEDVDLAKNRARIQSPVQSLAKRVAKYVRQDMQEAQAANDAARQQANQQDLVHLEHGDITRLSEGGVARRLMLSGASQGVFMSLFDSDSVLRRDIRGKANLGEHKVQWSQRGTQNFHMGVLGGTGSGLSTKVVTTAFSGAGHTPESWLAGFLLYNVVVAIIAAQSASETQTLKNFGKEGSPKPGTAGLAGRGLLSGFYQVAGRWKAADANQMMTAVLQDYSSEARQAQLLLDAFEGYDESLDGAAPNP